jgi:DUF1365 family protein
MNLRSRLYVGSVMHRRLRPLRHRLRYRVFWLLIDLDEIDILRDKLPLFSHNRFNAFSFYDADHGDGSEALRPQIEQRLAGAGIDPKGGSIELLCMPRILGYGFNPLSVYFCRDCRGDLAAIIYEVHNTFGQRHSYLIPVNPSDTSAINQGCDKLFYVSPFLDMNMRYRFRVEIPDQRVTLAISAVDRNGPVLLAAVSGDRRTLSNAALLGLLATYPLLTLKVIAAIHWNALQLWLKGLRVRPRPAPPPMPVTIVSGQE